MRWIEAIYEPTTLFSLKPSWATSSGAKSLLLPTPYAVKIALLDAALRVDGLPQARSAWPWLRSLGLAVRLPEQIVVTNLFTKILKLRRNRAESGAADAGPYQKSIAYREYVFLAGPVNLAVGIPADAPADVRQEQLIRWLLNINYLGKRGSLIQLRRPPASLDTLSDHIMLTEASTRFPLLGLAQQIDDCDEQMTFEQADIYDSKRPKRLVRTVVLPYRLIRSSRSYSLYERLG
ncbi:MAG: hypothetical protein HXY38_15460 [Chloroflexi bacterium]|nr:hypothetical protein [Chloroflexota bacterium]